MVMAMSTKTVKNAPVTPAFTASAELAADLQRALVDITALSLVGKQVHWNVVGPNFRDLHLNLDEVVDIAREGSDELAERMRAINAVTTTLREIHGAVDEADPSSSGILEDYTQRLEQQSWFLSAQNYSA